MGEKELTPSQSMIRLVMGFIPARAIYVAAKLGITDLMATGSLSAQELAQNVDVDVGALYRVLRILAGIGVLHESDDHRFSLTPLGETLRRDSTQSVRDYVLLFHEIHYKNLVNTMHSVRTGEPAFAETFGKPFFQFLQSNPDASGIFQAGLASRARIDIAVLLEAYDFSDARQIVDVGGGSGALLSAILTRFDNVTGVLFDLAPAIEAAKSGLGGPLPRCEFIVGDFFEEVASGADIYILKLVLHDWSDQDAIKILQRCRAAMTNGNRLLVIEGLIGSPNDPSPTHLMDVVMLVTFAGVERTEGEYTAVMEQAGFRLERTIPTKSDLYVLEAFPV
ncbi:MAG: methyltransferase [Gammaproteobacteria bacterium]